MAARPASLRGSGLTDRAIVIANSEPNRFANGGVSDWVFSGEHERVAAQHRRQNHRDDAFAHAFSFAEWSPTPHAHDSPSGLRDPAPQRIASANVWFGEEVLIRVIQATPGRNRQMYPFAQGRCSRECTRYIATCTLVV